MTVLPIRMYGDPALRQVAVDAPLDDRVRQLAADMVETMYDAPGRGLAAPQIGENLRLFVMDCHWKDGAERAPSVFLNPSVVRRSAAEVVNEEGCLSIPGVPVDVIRPASITMRWADLEGAAHEETFEGFEAVCVQHEADHLDGILNVDLASVTDKARIAPLLEALATG